MKAKPIRRALAGLAALACLSLASPAEAAPTPTYRYGGAEVTAWHNDRTDPNITLEQGRVLAHYFNGIIQQRLARWLTALHRSSLVSRWSGVAQCESGGNWAINTGNGYYGGVQFSLSTWRAYGGYGYPHQQPAWYQATIADRVRVQSGLHHWPHCGAFYG